MSLILPREDESGYYISYSQIKLWNEIKGYNTGLSGKKEYIRSYFLGEEYPDKGGFGTFGSEAEAYITERKEADKFTDAERVVLEQITPLGVFQRKIKVPFDGFYLLGYIDDSTEDCSQLRDYKTASEKSKAKYYEDDYFQLDIYAMGIKAEFGRLPEKLEVCIIERLGNGFKGGREALKVGTRVWYHPRQTSLERLEKLSNTIVQTATEISKFYEVFLALNQ
jgi:hypothetical protein